MSLNKEQSLCVLANNFKQTEKKLFEIAVSTFPMLIDLKSMVYYFYESIVASSNYLENYGLKERIS